MGRPTGNVAYPVGDTLNNGMDVGGARIYPFSNSLAIQPPAYYSDYIGSATGLMVTPPVAALTTTAGSTSGQGVIASHVAANPFGTNSPLPYALGGLVLGVGALYAIHYRKR